MAGYARYDDSFDEDNRQVVHGVLFDIGPALRIQDIEGLIKQCFQFRYFEMYEGLAQGEAFFAVDQTEFDHLEKALVIYDGDIKIKRLYQKVQIYKIHLPNERKNAFLKRCLAIAGVEAVDRDHIKCCDYQLKLINRFLSTQGSKLADPSKILTSIESHDDDDSDEDEGWENYQDSGDLDFLDLEPTPNRRLTPKSVYAQMDEPVQASSPSTSQNKKFEFKISYDHTFSHNGNLRSQNGLSVIVKEADLTQTKADCLLNYFLLNSDIINIVSNQLGEKAGLGYQVELTSQVSTRRLRSSTNDDCMIFHTQPGKLAANAKYVVQLGQNYVDPNNLAKKFKSLFNAYLQLFDYVESALGTEARSLAIRMIGDNEDRDLSIISLIEALNQYYFHKTVCLKSNIKVRQHANLRELYIVSMDPLPLMVLQEYLTNGFQADFLSQLFDENNSSSSDEESQTVVHKDDKESRTLTEADYADEDDDDDLETLQAKFLSLADKVQDPGRTSDTCLRCRQVGELAFVTWERTRLFNHLIDFRGCLARNGGRTCEVCSIFANLLKINVKELLHATPGFKASDKACVCLKCYFELFVDQLRRDHCSSCLRDLPASTSVNKQCQEHAICAKCSFLPKNMSYCYYCTVVHKLYRTMFEHVNASSRHDNIDCCFDYLDYEELVSADKSLAAGSTKKKKMACGHLAFPADLLLLPPGAAEANVCGFCTMAKLTKMILDKQKNAVDYEIVDDLDIDQEQEEIEDEEEQEQEQVTEDESDQADDDKSPTTSGRDVNNNLKEEPAAIFTHIKYLAEPLPGFPNINTIELQFYIPNGVQKATDPQPGERYFGTVKSVYLPGNRQGKDLARLIGQMLDNDKLITIVKAPDGKSWMARLNNRIELKTSKSGGIYNNGYPDEGYLDRLEKQLQSL